MIETFAVALLCLALVDLLVGRSLLYPPVLFCLAWSGNLLLLASLGDAYFTIADETVLLFFAGAVAMSLGGAAELLLESAPGRPVRAPRRDEPGRAAAVERMLDLGFLAIVLALPLRMLRLRQLGGGTIDLGSPAFWVNVRQASIVESNQSAMSWLTLTDNVVLFALFLALAAVAHDVARRRFRMRTALLVLLALLYQVSTASRASGTTLVCGLVGIAALARGRWSVRSLAYGAAAIVATFSFAAVLMGKGGQVDAGLLDNVFGIARAALLYLVGPTVAFDRALADPSGVPAVWSVTYSVAQVANKLGAGIELPSIHAVFSHVGTGLWMNAYTMYFAYVPDLGVTGALALLFALGMSLTWLFRRAEAGSPHARLLYATMLSGLVMSGFGEYFFMNLSFYVKAALFGLVLYGLPPLDAVRAVSRAAGIQRRGAPRPLASAE